MRLPPPVSEAVPPAPRRARELSRVRGGLDHRRRRLLDVSAPDAPPLERLEMDGFVVSDYGDPDRAGIWVNCAHGPTCPNRAYLASLFPDVSTAIASIPERAEALTRQVRSWRPQAVTRQEPFRYEILHLIASDVLGRDYRRDGCALPHGARDLRDGSGTEQAWDEVRRQRVEEDADGALLPGQTVLGDLFLFVGSASRCVTTYELVHIHEWHG